MKNKRPICKECKNHEQISDEEFNRLPYEIQRRLDCKNLIEDSQCCCYSKEHLDKEDLNKGEKMKKNKLEQIIDVKEIEKITSQRLRCLPINKINGGN